MNVYAELPPLRVDPKLKRALDTYAKQIGVPRARVIRQILREFLGPMAQDLGPTETRVSELVPDDEFPPEVG